MEKKELEEATYRFKSILIHAYQKGEFSSNLKPKGLIEVLSI
jgi:hypothetical protein